MTKWWWLLFFLPTLSLWRPGIFESGDFGFHVMVLISFYKSLAAGIMVPRWAADFCNGLGYPHFQYFYSLPYYLAALFHTLGLSFIASLKLLLMGSYVGAGMAMLAWLRQEFPERAARVGSLAYVFTPYVLAQLHFRHVLGEMLGFVIVPLVLICTRRLVITGRWQWGGGVVGLFSLLIMSHHIVPLLVLPFVVAYAWYVSWSTAKSMILMISRVMFCLLISLLLTIFHWLPIMREASWVRQSQLQTVQFEPSASYFFSPWKLGLLYQGPQGQVRPLIGYAQEVLILIALWLMWQKKITSIRYRVLTIGLLMGIVGLLLAMQPVMQPLWESLPIIKNFQFAHRLLWVMVLLTAIITAIVVTHWSQVVSQKMTAHPDRWLLVASGVMVMSTLLNWGNRGMIPDINDHIAGQQIPGRCDQVALPKWLSKEREQVLLGPSSQREPLNTAEGQAVIIPLTLTPERQRYLVELDQRGLLVAHTLYFPGWQVMANEQPVPLLTELSQQTGEITFQLPPGKYEVEIVYRLTPLQRWSRTISQVTAVGIILLSVLVVQPRLFRSHPWPKTQIL